ncbi:hypothetical protein ACFQXB_11500 [Plastorhodobacter daqingensis]|uniref:Uncharacterized protein n=1 Tax=Plastorhodobacter daqingensis TaxID=1387281 RepID=A0ABW2UND5_9RHOB
MNTANPQLEGLYLALSGVLDLLVQKGVLERDELRAALADAEALALDGGALASDSESHRKAMAFPARVLMMALESHARGEQADFRDLARRVGLST